MLCLSCFIWSLQHLNCFTVGRYGFARSLVDFLSLSLALEQFGIEGLYGSCFPSYSWNRDCCFRSSEGGERETSELWKNLS